MSMESILQKVGRYKGQRDLLIEQRKRYKKAKRKILSILKDVEVAKDIINLVALETQSQLEFKLAHTTTMAEEAVFDDPYSLVVNFIQKRGKTECELKFSKDGENELDPISSSGYGAVDIACFALRVSSLKMDKETPPILFLDEPFRHLKGEEANRRAIGMTKSVSDELGIQVITISDERAPREDIKAGADLVFLTSQKKGVSIVEEIS